MQRPLLLGGFMAAGKSSVGRRAAELAGVPFEDLDETIERRAGASIAEIFEAQGEAAFRRLERSELARVLDGGGPRVVALGGGALLERSARLDALERGVVVTLEAPLDVLLARARTGSERPLLRAADPEARARELLAARRIVYAEAHARVDTGALDVDASAQRVLELWRDDPIAVAAGERTHSVRVDVGLLTALPRAAGEPSGVLVVTDENVDRLHSTLLRALGLPRPHFCVLPAGEAHKTTAALERVWQAAFDAELDRSGLVIAVGGGVVSDVAGLAAATWMRGVSFIVVPTTLLAMVDASVGGKTAVDFASAKNVVGAFWQPRAVLADIDFLATEPERNHRSALAEVVKTALVGDAPLLDLLERDPDRVLGRDPAVSLELVRRSVAVKARIVSRDERESGLRRVLNLGHTLGHALEAATGYAEYSHGEAVSLGLVAALRVGRALGITPAPVAARVASLLGRLGLPVDLSRAPLAAALEHVARDKKRQGTYIHFVLVEDVGRVDTTRIELAEIPALLRER